MYTVKMPKMAVQLGRNISNLKLVQDSSARVALTLHTLFIYRSLDAPKVDSHAGSSLMYGDVTVT